LQKLPQNKYQLLLERVKSLEKENKLLSERAEESLLLKLVTESINVTETEETLLVQVLEKISIIKNIPLCACFDIVNSQLVHIDHYVDFTDQLSEKFSINLNSDLLSELENGPYLEINIQKERSVELVNLPKKFHPYAIALIPFTTLTHPAGLFVFIDNVNSESKLSTMIVLLQNIVHMTEARLDNISLLTELKEMNTALEHNIDRRTKELKISNQKLEKEIFERKKVLEALVVSEEKFREIFNNASDALYLWELKQDGKIEKCLEVNEVACKMTGYSREELLKFTPDKLNDKESKKKIPLVLKNLSKDRNITFRAIHVTKSGNQIPVEVSAHLFKLKNKKVILSITRDISKRLAAESALRESEEKYRLLFSAERDAIVIIDRVTNRIVDTNSAALKLYGYSKNEFLSKSALDLSDDREMSTKNITNMEKMGKADIVLQYNKHRKKDGTVFPVEVRAGNFEYSGKIMIYAVFRDISERVKAEESLRKLSRSVEQSPVSVVITDKEGDIEYVNPKFTQVTGYSLSEAIGKNPRILKSGSKSKDEYKNLWDTIISGAEWRGEFQNKRKNGEVYWENATISPIKSESGEITHFLAVKEDITERKRLQQ
jgi:PAS domain S-box-containing protein